MKKLIAEIKTALEAITDDIDKNTKASEARVRKATLRLEKLGKTYRSESIAQHK